MARFDDLPADQKAVLQLVLRQGRTYEEIAGLLKISPEAVRDRALTALDALGPEDAGGVDPDRQDEIGDYLLGQLSASARAETRANLEADAAARAWARTVAGELRGAGAATDDALPEIPADPAEVDEAFDALDARRRARTDQARSSRLGGVLLLGALAIVIAGAVLLLTHTIGGSDDKSGTLAAATGTTTTTGSSATPAGTATTEKQINLLPPGGATGANAKRLGVVSVVSQDGQRALAVVAQNLPASGHYVLWLRNGAKVKFLGFFPPVSGTGTSKGKLQGLVAAPSDLSTYKEILVSREPSSAPKQPTAIVLQGDLAG
jgi:anti-sigma-K factor RskA